MTSIYEYIKESIEDGKYLAIPTTDLYKTFYGRPGPKPREYRMHYGGPNGKATKEMKSPALYAKEMEKYKEHIKQLNQQKKEHDAAWKAHEELCTKVNEENFAILVSKIAKLMENKARRDDFIKTQLAGVLELIKTNGNDKSNWELDKLNATLRKVKGALSLENTYYVNRTNTYSSESPYEASIYGAVAAIARLYQIDVPKFSEDGIKKQTILSVNDRMGNSARSEASYQKARERAYKAYEKDEAKIKKAREEFHKTEQYKTITRIVDQFEDDIETIHKMADKAYIRYDELNGKNKAFDEAKEKVKATAEKYIENEFHSIDDVSCWGNSLIDILATLYVAGDKNPNVQAIESRTSSWMAGMQHSCKFKVTASDGAEYTTGRYEDRGLGNAPGFGPYD